MNIRSISNKFDKLTNFLSQPRVKLHIVGTSETWLDVDCYHFFRYCGLQIFFCINLESIALVEVLAFTFVNEHLNYKGEHAWTRCAVARFLKSAVRVLNFFPKIQTFLVFGSSKQ